MAAGTKVHHIRHAGLVHGFLSLDTESPAALEAGNNLLRQFGAVTRREEPPKSCAPATAG